MAEQQKKEQEYTLLGNPWEKDVDFSEGQAEDRIASLEKYNYFQAEKIINSIKLS